MPIIPDQPDILFKASEDTEMSQDALYYLSTKMQSGYFSNSLREKVMSWMNNPEAIKKSFSSYKTYKNKTCIALKPDLKTFKKIDWEKVILNRSSTRSFSGRPMSFTELSSLLILCCGLKEKGEWLAKPKNENHWPRRSLPSGGGMYPLEFYTLIYNVRGLKRGLYHFTPLYGGLSLLRDDEATFDSDEFSAQKFLFQRPAVTIFVTSIFERTRVKYGGRALRFILLEAGGVGAQMNLIANAMQVDFCFDGGGHEDRIENLIGVDGRKEGLVTSFHLGHRK